MVLEYQQIEQQKYVKLYHLFIIYKICPNTLGLYYFYIYIMKQFIYTLTDPISNDIKYIGKTKNPKDRLQRHMSPYSLKQSWQSKNKWLKNLKNNGLKPIMELLDEGDENNIDDLEIYWIAQFKTWGFNLKNETEGGQNPTPKGSRLKERHVQNLNKSNKRKKIVVQYNIDNTFVAEYESISEAERQTTFHHVSDCCNGKRKQCGNYYFRFKDNYYPYVERTDYWTGAHHSEETIKKLRTINPLKKSICQYSIEDDKLISEYESGHDVERLTGLARRHIMKCCKGVKNFNSVGGFYFRYKDNYFPLVKGNYYNKCKIIRMDENFNVVEEFSSMNKSMERGYNISKIKKSIKNNEIYFDSYWKIVN